MGRAKVSLTVSIRLICSAISMAVFSRFSHRIRLRPTLIGCIGICAVGFLLCSRAYALWQFYLAFAVMGLAYVIPITLMPPILLAAWFPTHFGTVLGITGCLSGLGGAIFNPLISHVIASYGWRSAYLLTGVMLMVLLLPCSYLLKPYPHGKLDTASAPNAKPAHDTRTKSGHLIGMLRSPAFLLLSAAMILLQIVSGINQHIPAYGISIGLTLTQAAWVVTARMIGASVGKLAIGSALDRVRPQFAITLFAAIGTTGWFSLLFGANLEAAITASFLVGIGQCLLMIALPWSIRRVFPGDDYARALSVINATGQLTVAIATTVHGLIFDMTGGYGASLTLNVLLYVLAAIAIITVAHGHTQSFRHPNGD
jgi:MFS family permease